MTGPESGILPAADVIRRAIEIGNAPGVSRMAGRSKTRNFNVSQPKVEIYTKAFCGFCIRAKRLLDSKGVDYTEYDISMGGPKREEMMQRKPDARTVPQIFIDDKPIGGSDDLAALEREGKLDELLSA